MSGLDASHQARWLDLVPALPDHAAMRRMDDDSSPTLPLTNGGPPLDDDPRPWGTGKVGNFFVWAAAVDKAYNDVPYDIAVMRVRRAHALGLTYREYTLEILERGIYLSAERDAERIAEIKRRRPLRY
jgi:hypothetical protein